LLQNFQGLIAHAEATYARLIPGLGPQARNRLIAELVARAPTVDDEQILRLHKCPACRNSLWVVYDVQRDLEVDDSDAPHSFGLFAKVRADVRSASCPVCDLSLDQVAIVRPTFRSRSTSVRTRSPLTTRKAGMTLAPRRMKTSGRATRRARKTSVKITKTITTVHSLTAHFSLRGAQ
jgi:hypothetical protein